MAIDDTVDLTLDELSVIIHGLRMHTLSFVEDAAVDEIEAMIKALPLPEQMNKLAQYPSAIKNLQRSIGNIMRLTELYGKRDVEFKTRYKSRTGLPPRYKVLDWRSDMKAVAQNVIRDMVRVSSIIDNKGYGEISGKINKFASDMVQDKLNETEYEKIAVALKDSGLEKEAQFWSGVKEMFGGMKDRFYAGKYKAAVQDIFTRIDKLYKDIGGEMGTGGAASKVKDPYTLDVLSKLFAQLGQMWNVGKGLVQYQDMAEKAEQKSSAGTQTSQAAQTAQTPQAAQSTRPAQAAQPPTNQQMPQQEKTPATPTQPAQPTQPKFKKGDVLNYNGQEVQFVQALFGNQAKVRNVNTGRINTVRVRDLKPSAKAPVKQTASFNLKMHKSAQRG